MAELGGFEATAIGSLPYRDPQRACELIFHCLPVIPHWPQLPVRDPKEGMVRQFLEGMPGVVETEEGGFLRPPHEVPGEWEAFYEAWQEGRLEAFAIGQERAAGLHTFLRLVGQISPPFVKGQVTGPVTMGFSLKDSEGRAAFYDDELREMIVAHVCMKARWQQRALKEAAPEAETIIFFDEPALAGYGSVYMNVDREAILRALRGAMEGVEGLRGVHVCANTDWPLILEVGYDIVNFDAYGYLEEFLLWGEEIKKFLSRGGLIAWGMVPTRADDLGRVEPEELLSALKRGLRSLGEAGVGEELLHRSLITPSCGAGSLDEDQAARAYRLLMHLRDSLRREG